MYAINPVWGSHANAQQCSQVHDINHVNPFSKNKDEEEKEIGKAEIICPPGNMQSEFYM